MHICNLFYMHMRTTLNIDEKKYKEAVATTGVKEKTRLIHMGLDSLIQDKAMKNLASLFGKAKKAKAPRRRRIYK
ncbi:MAG TPA: DUF2191 domain-containing protein [Deltaproteobacteria bacterium]|nr:DUF2191 domain-containing protein [Deltaproteobacteria bacterium]